MAGLNRQMVIGNLAADAEMNMVGEKGTPKAVFRVISNTGYGDYEHTEGFNVALWGRRAESLLPYLKKGRRVYVDGETQTQSWEGGDGKKRYRTEIVLGGRGGEIVLLGGNGSKADVQQAEDIPFD